MAKKTMSASISEEVLKRFKTRCDEGSINRSDLIEKWILKFLDGGSGKDG